jgi:hypothetical protein
MRILVLIVLVLCFLVNTPSGIAQKKPTQGKSAKPSKTETAPRQQPPMPVLPDIRNDPDVKAADVAIIANVTAEELRFDVVPNSTVEFSGKPRSETIWHADRFNLPDKIEPGVTYRNIGIRLKITSSLADIDRIVAEALGEIPKDPGKNNNDVMNSGPSKPAINAPAQKPAPTKKVPGE